MEVPLELAFKDVQRTDVLDEFIEEKLERLGRVCDYIVSCRLTVEKPQRHQHSARLVVRVPPNHEIVAKRESSAGDSREQLITVVDDVFEAARRQLQSLVDRQKGLVKHHPEKEEAAVVARLFREEGYGFLRTADGTEIYFHRNSVLHDEFDLLEVGAGVRYEVEDGEKGPQATTVELVEKRGPNYAPPDEQVLELPMGREARGRS
ncbi:MAG: HPF/RaiA family ribosome-associated protein [Candidatus Hydrogenedentes bacterium]|nr:HPF/RaiA family ribosome-associated protein [Candidatus Hydrogenedentota bacterium]